MNKTMEENITIECNKQFIQRALQLNYFKMESSQNIESKKESIKSKLLNAIEQHKQLLLQKREELLAKARREKANALNQTESKLDSNYSKLLEQCKNNFKIEKDLKYKIKLERINKI